MARIVEISWTRRGLARGSILNGRFRTAVFAPTGYSLSTLEEACLAAASPGELRICLPPWNLQETFQWLQEGRGRPTVVMVVNPHNSGPSVLRESARLCSVPIDFLRTAKRLGIRRWHLIALTRGAFEPKATTNNRQEPVEAVLPGILRTMALEEGGLTWSLLDIDRSPEPNALRAEFNSHLMGNSTGITSLRGRECFFQVTRTPKRSEEANLRHGGTYLITGGLGSLGQATAVAIAEATSHSQLILMTRSGQVPFDSPRGRGEFIKTLNHLGAQVSVIRGDVCDSDRMSHVLSRACSKPGGLNGVVHAAGTADDERLVHRAPDSIDRILRPKTLGSHTLVRLTAGLNLDFLTLFGSYSSLTGLIGAGDYAAANSFGDMLAVTAFNTGRHVQSVSWPSWSGWGMAVRAGIDPGQTAMSIDPAEGGRAFIEAIGIRAPHLAVLLSGSNNLPGYSHED